jgi:hypothetical protein
MALHWTVDPPEITFKRNGLLRWIIKSVLKVAFPKYLVVIIRRCKMCIEHAGQQFEQFL